jgi:NAD(P)-dependent dehydrogenase (short-subunit alcohol dehydrogenase family)
VFVEVGPRAVLTHLVSAILAPRPHLAVATDLPEAGLAQFLVALGQLLAHGRPVSLDRLFAGRAVRSLDLAALASETAIPALAPNTWLVNGCRAWPADQPAPLCGDGLLLREGEEMPALIGGAARRLPPAEEGSVLARHREFLRELDEANLEILDLYAASIAHSGEGDVPAPVAATEERLPDVPAREEDILPALLTVVSERTGYPPAMLDPDLHMEADLGIDSIKRMEILAVVQSEYLSDSASLSTPEMEELLQLSTLRQLCAWLGDHLRPSAAAPPTAPETAAPAAPAETRRLVLRMAPAPELPVAAPRFEADRVVLITDDEGGVAEAFAALVRASGGRPVVVRHRRESAPPEGSPYQADLTSPEAVRTLLARVCADEGPPCALVHLLPLAPGSPFADLTLEEWRERARREVKALFYLSQAAAGNLRAPVPGGRTWLVAALASDTSPEHGGVGGFLGTAAREWPEVACKAVDFAPSVDPTEVAARLLSEMATGDSRVRVRYEAHRRLQPSADFHALDEALPASLTPTADWVFLLTGGARGITAEVALELAERYQPTLVLLGRAAPPAEESAATAGLTTRSELKLALLEELQGTGPAVGVREVETAYRRLLQDREIRDNLAALRQTGARVSYHQVDVRDETALAELMRKIEAEHGRLDVVIHGAGVIEDKLIADKQPDSFDRVFDTKTDGAFLLSRLLHPDTLRCLIFFTSVAGPLGNPGQSDYAAANEVLTELAAHLDRAWPARVVALHWGPWARRGMVTAEMEASLARNRARPRGRWSPPPSKSAGNCPCCTGRRWRGAARTNWS